MFQPTEEPVNEGAPDWMVSYADMITILMAFFAVMYSIAGAKDAKKDVPFMRSLQRQFGKLVGLPTTISAPEGSSLTAKAAAKTTLQSNSPYRGLGGDPRASAIRSGDQVMIGSVIHFDSGTSVLNEQQRQQLQTVAKDLGGNPLKIEIWGHTLGRIRDADGKLGDNWSLAYARCNSTMSYLVSQGIEPRRIRIGVAAQFEPIYAGRDVHSLETNSRVEVFLLDESSEVGRAVTDDHPGN